MGYLDLAVKERRALDKDKADKISALSTQAKAAFETAIRWGGAISPDLAQAIADEVLKADKAAQAGSEISAPE